uniref:Transposase n=1 Tax=Globodera rostochiensis TaxID=31243 RepID=A0A914HQ37_GLORO
MSITKSTDRTPKLDKLNPIQLIILDKLNPIQLIRIFLSQSLITLDKLNPIQLIILDKLNPIQLIRILLSQKKFDQRKAELKQAGFKNSYNHEIDKTVAKELGLSDTTIYRWKSELGQTRSNYSDDEKIEIVKKFMQMKSEHSEKFDQRKAELKRVGIKNSYDHEIDEIVAKELGITNRTIYNWKKELDQTKPKHKYSDSEQKELMKRYYEIKNQNSKISDKDIAKMLNIGKRTLIRWKKQFKRQQLYPNSVDGHSVEENAAANVQGIGNSNSGSI